MALLLGDLAGTWLGIDPPHFCFSGEFHRWFRQVGGRCRRSVSCTHRGVSDTPFVDHYETLQLSSTADNDTVERVYRLLAKRYHPDKALSGDSVQFNANHKAYEVLSDLERRAKYDVAYEEEKGHQWRIFDQGTAAAGPEQDRRIFHGVLSMLYVARRRDPEEGGLGAVHLERMLGVPREHLEFPLWYLRQRGWTETLVGGKIAITVDGIDVLGKEELSLPRDRLLATSSLDQSAYRGQELRRHRRRCGGHDGALPGGWCVLDRAGCRRRAGVLRTDLHGRPSASASRRGARRRCDRHTARGAMFGGCQACHSSHREEKPGGGYLARRRARYQGTLEAGF